MNSITGMSPSIYVLLGSPGSGKGTFAQTISPEGYEHISTGDITRDEVRKATPFGLKYREAILNHVIGGIPFDEIQKLVENRIEQAITNHKGVILDGYPKTISQCEFLDKFIEMRMFKDKVVYVLFDVKEADAVDRILCRQTCEKCNRIYNTKFSPSKLQDTCDECFGTLSMRMDDSVEGTKKRVLEFDDRMHPVIDYYTQSNRLTLLDTNASPEICRERFYTFHKSRLGAPV